MLWLGKCRGGSNSQEQRLELVSLWVDSTSSCGREWKRWGEKQSECHEDPPRGNKQSKEKWFHNNNRPSLGLISSLEEIHALIILSVFLSFHVHLAQGI
jgi:hypothetical protein